MGKQLVRKLNGLGCQEEGTCLGHRLSTGRTGAIDQQTFASLFDQTTLQLILGVRRSGIAKLEVDLGRHCESACLEDGSPGQDLVECCGEYAPMQDIMKPPVVVTRTKAGSDGVTLTCEAVNLQASRIVETTSKAVAVVGANSRKDRRVDFNHVSSNLWLGDSTTPSYIAGL